MEFPRGARFTPPKRPAERPGGRVIKVRFTPKADKSLHRSEMTRCANSADIATHIFAERIISMFSMSLGTIGPT
jgi:hypothetical protein